MALLVSGLVHGLVLATGTAMPLLQPKLHQVGKLSLLLVPAEGLEEPASDPNAKTAPAPQPVAPDPPEKPAPTKPSRPEPKPEPQPIPQAVDDEPAEVAEATPPRDEPDAARRQASAREVNVSPQPAPGARQAVQARLEEELAEYFYYPFMARRRGWEGEVVLALRVTARGRVDSVEITNSSGHKVLDRAALDAIAKVSRIPGTKHWLNGSDLHLQLPVIYRLREG